MTFSLGIRVKISSTVFRNSFFSTTAHSVGGTKMQIMVTLCPKTAICTRQTFSLTNYSNGSFTMTPSTFFHPDGKVGGEIEIKIYFVKEENCRLVLKTKLFC